MAVIDDQACPFCQGNNACGAQGEAPCWCFEAEVPEELLALVPVALKRKSCVCQGCILKFKENPKGFQVELNSNQPI